MKQQKGQTANVVKKQYAVNWTVLKKLYLQGAQKIHSPLPDFDKKLQHNQINIRQITNKQNHEHNLKIILAQVYKKNDQFLNKIQQQYSKINLHLQQRIFKLQQLIHTLKKTITSLVSKHQIQPYRKQQQINQYTPQINPEGSFIHIEQKQQISLLQGIQQNLPNNKQKITPQKYDQQQTIKKQIINKIFYDKQISRNIFKHNQKFSTNSHQINQNQQEPKLPKFLQKNYQSIHHQINNLRQFIEKTHDVQIPLTINQQFSRLRLPESSLNSKQIIFQIKEAQQHLHNQNSQLRSIINKYKSQLINAKHQLSTVKNILQKALHDQFQIIEFQ